MIAQNIEILRDRILRACEKAGRNRDDISVVAVSKTFDADRVREAAEAGIRDFGENYVQELQRKRTDLPDDLRWHFVGHLQTNKVRQIADYVHLIHSVDNLRLAKELQKRAEKAGRTIDVLVEVHTTDEATKYGVAPEETAELVGQIAELDRVQVRGLMTMGPFSDDPNDSRPSFRQVVELKKSIEDRGWKRVSMDELSMGMTHDFEAAIEEGATILRIGTAIFGERKTQ